MLKPLLASLVAVGVSALIAIAGSNNSLSYAGLPIFMLCASVAFVLHWLGFIPAYIFQTEHYFDLIGSISYVATVALAVLLVPSMDLRALVVGTAVCVWAVRLGSFLFARVKRAGQDRRFTHIKPLFFRFLFTWTLGGTWVFITMAAGLAAMTSQTRVPIDSFFIPPMPKSLLPLDCGHSLATLTTSVKYSCGSASRSSLCRYSKVGSGSPSFHRSSLASCCSKSAACPCLKILPTHVGAMILLTKNTKLVRRLWSPTSAKPI